MGYPSEGDIIKAWDKGVSMAKSLALEVEIIPNTVDGQRNGNNNNDSDGDDSDGGDNNDSDSNDSDGDYGDGRGTGSKKHDGSDSLLFASVVNDTVGTRWCISCINSTIHIHKL